MSELNITVGIKPKTIYRLEARRSNADGKIVSRRVSADVPNVFMNDGVEVLFGENAPQSFSRSSLSYGVGTGSATPVITEPYFDNFLVSGSRVNGSENDEFVELPGTPRIGYFEFRQDALFAMGSSGGNVNISEVGASFRGIDSGNPLCSRALVVDVEGNPTTFEWLEDEELLLTAFHRRYISLEDVVYENVPVSGDGPNQTITIRPCRLGSVVSWGWPGNFSSQASVIFYWGDTYTLPDPYDNNHGSSSGAGSGSGSSANPGMNAGSEPYVPGSKQRTRWGEIPSGVARNIVGAGLSSSASSQQTHARAFGAWAIKIEPGIPKSELHRFRMGMTFKIDNTP